jgi:glycosyltransferase involved in cell wall biosynthesis
MTAAVEPVLSINGAPSLALSLLVPTRNRAPSLRPMLRSLERALAATAVPLEILIVDNGSTDETATVVEQWVAAGPGRHRLFIKQPGKSRALNWAMRGARGELLAFTDDDVEVDAGWLAAIVDFFARHPQYDAGMGRVLVPPAVTDPCVLERIRCYETLPLFDRGDTVCDLTELCGCNMVLRRRVVDTVGLFDERFGPGASGFGEEPDLCERMRHAGLRIGYMPGAIVYHSVDVTRLTAAFFGDYHRRKARGDFAWAPERFARKNLSSLFDASLRWAWCGVTGDARRRLRARMRMIRHAEFLRLRWQRMRRRIDAEHHR